MQKDNNLQFIREKIYGVRSAIMYSMSNELVKIPNHIVNAVEVDDEGQLWFVCTKPLQLVDQCEQHFPARLKFYRKGIMYFLEVSGKASIVTDKAGYNNMTHTGDDTMLIKMTMNEIEYAEPEEKKETIIDVAVKRTYNWLLRTVAFARHTKPVFSKIN